MRRRWYISWQKRSSVAAVQPLPGPDFLNRGLTAG